MSQPPPWDHGQPSHQDQPPDQGQQTPWPAGNQPPAWPSTDSGRGQPPSWPSGDQPPAWPAGHADQPPPPSWPPAGQPPYPDPGYTHGYAPRPPRFRRRRPRFIGAIITLGLFIALGVAVGRISHSHETVSVTPSPSASGALATGLRKPPGQIGSSFDLNDGSGHAYRVTLVKVIDPAKGEAEFTVPASGKRFVGLVFKVKALTGSLQDEDANNDAAVIGGNSQTYAADFSGIAGYTNFRDGAIQAAQGETVTGSVTFQVPNGVPVSKVRWTALSGYGSTVEWIVPG